MVRDRLRERARKAAQQRRRVREASRAELAAAHQRARAEAASASEAAISLQELNHVDGTDALRAVLSAAEAQTAALLGDEADAAA
eukprot:5703824-Prymnesium_polylepis.1